MTPDLLRSLQAEIGNWSYVNFGHQESKRIRVMDKDGESVAALDHLAPLMGIMEELGEFNSADIACDRVDAIADMSIYFFDYCNRSMIDVVEMINSYEGTKHTLPPLVSALGKMFHVELKHLQGIRRYADPIYYLQEKKKAAFLFIMSLASVAHEYSPPGISLADLTKQTWDAIVSKRDWKKNVQTGNS